MLTGEQLRLLNKILSTESPSGCEGQIICLLQNHLQSICRMETDTIGNLYMSCVFLTSTPLMTSGTRSISLMAK